MIAVFRPGRFSRLLSSDARNVGRDPTLLFAMLASVVPAIAVCLFRSRIDAAAREAFGLDRLVFYAMPSLLCLPAALIGWVGGFLFLEDRDDGVLLALDITPVGKGGFMLYRTSITMAVGFAIALASCRLLLPGMPVALQIATALLIALEALIAALVLSAIARNKVEGLALTKLTNLAIVFPLIALVPSPLRFAAGIVPSFWIGELLGLSGPSALPVPITLSAAACVHATVAMLLYRLVVRRPG